MKKIIFLAILILIGCTRTYEVPINIEGDYN